jgi:hypothetical protein
MIELFKHLTIPMEIDAFGELSQALKAAVTQPWSYVGVREPDFVVGGKSVSFAYRGGPLPDANLSLAWYDGKATIGNIVPTAFGQLTMSQYNRLLDDFHDNHVLPIATEMKLSVEVSKGARDIADWLSPLAKQKLESFSLLANKGSGSSHPSDHQRWQEFIVQAHLEEAKLPSDVLRRWLIEELHWPETVASDLEAEFTDGIELLERYDDLR